jgi:nucleotide-binding universal stress UspA family protein
MNAGVVLGMLAVVAAGLVLAVAATALLGVRRPWRLACPRDGREAQVQVDATAEVRAEVFGGERRVARCSLWPVRACAEACLEVPVTARRAARRGEPLPRRPGRPTVLVPLDGTRAGEAVLPAARALAREHDARLRLLRVAQPVESVRDEDGRTIAYADQEAGSVETEARHYLRRVQEVLEGSGFDVETVVRFGDTAEEILHEAEVPDVTLIIMGPRRHRWPRRSVTARVARAAWVPVVQAGSGAMASTGRAYP